MPEGGRKLLALVVDDEEIIADTLVVILNRDGFDARAAYSGETGLVLARALKPDVLISDVVMNGMSGVELAIKVSNEIPQCRIVLFSGQAATEDLLQEAEANGHHFNLLKKPLRPEDLLHHLLKHRV